MMKDMMKEKDEPMSFAKSIVELKLASDRLAEGSVGIFTLKYQILYLIGSVGKISPSELIYELNMAKSNLAIITKKMMNEGLIDRYKEAGNKKQIYYRITEKGREVLNSKMTAIDKLYSVDKEMLVQLADTVEKLKKVK